MKPLSVEMACLLGIQNEIQAVWHTLHLKKVVDKSINSVKELPTSYDTIFYVLACILFKHDTEDITYALQNSFLCRPKNVLNFYEKKG